MLYFEEIWLSFPHFTVNTLIAFQKSLANLLAQTCKRSLSKAKLFLFSGCLVDLTNAMPSIVKEFRINMCLNQNVVND